MKQVEANRHGINENRKDIAYNKTAIEELKTEVKWVIESAQARLERIIHRLIAVIILLIVLLVTTTAIWIYAWNTWDNDATTVYNKDANYIGGDGVIDDAD